MPKKQPCSFAFAKNRGEPNSGLCKRTRLLFGTTQSLSTILNWKFKMVLSTLALNPLDAIDV